MLCAHCDAPIHYVKAAGGWLHSLPLARLRVSRWEAEDIYRDPPRPKQVLHRRTYIHPAQPTGAPGAVRPSKPLVLVCERGCGAKSGIDPCISPDEYHVWRYVQ